MSGVIIATHNGKFHADDVFGVTLLLQLYPDATVVRSRDPKVLETADIVLDVGGVYDPDTLRFDHHQKTSGARDNGILYSAFGLLWQHYGMEFCDGDEDVWKRIDRSLVQCIDAGDNGQDLYALNDFHARPIEISEVLGWFNPVTLVGEEDFDDQFMVAVTVATQLLRRLLLKSRDAIEGKRYFTRAYDQTPDARYVVLDQFVPHGGIASKQPLLQFVVFPNANGDWAIKTVQVDSSSFESRVLLPEAWRGADQEHLAELTGVPDVVFTHKVGFIGAAKTKQGALKMLAQALEQPASREFDLQAKQQLAAVAAAPASAPAPAPAE
nr:MYG1 family protein [Pseudoclavibacter sp. 13-3]